MEKSRIRRMVESFNENRETIISTWIRNHKPPVVHWLVKPLPVFTELSSTEVVIDASELEASCKFTTKQDSFGRRYIEVTVEGYPVWSDPMHFSADWPKPIALDTPDEFPPEPRR